MVEFAAMNLMVDAKTMRGCVYGATDPARDFPEMIRMQQAGRLDLESLVSQRIPLTDLNEAFAAMEAGDVVRSVIVY
jgi:S-(hydroxymethyl)glutathione dehydrogenase/alcohol dehydrogenase